MELTCRCARGGGGLSRCSGRAEASGRTVAGLGWKGSREILPCFGGQFALPYTELEKLGVLRFPKRASGSFLLSDAKV